MFGFVNTVVTVMRGGDREWDLRPGAPPPPCCNRPWQVTPLQFAACQALDLSMQQV